MAPGSGDAHSASAQRPYVDRQGRRYTETVLTWSEATRRALGIRLATDAELQEASDAPLR